MILLKLLDLFFMFVFKVRSLAVKQLVELLFFRFRRGVCRFYVRRSLLLFRCQIGGELRDVLVETGDIVGLLRDQLVALRQSARQVGDLRLRGRDLLVQSGDGRDMRRDRRCLRRDGRLLLGGLFFQLRDARLELCLGGFQLGDICF